MNKPKLVVGILSAALLAWAWAVGKKSTSQGKAKANGKSKSGKAPVSASAHAKKAAHARKRSNPKLKIAAKTGTRHAGAKSAKRPVQLQA